MTHSPASPTPTVDIGGADELGEYRSLSGLAVVSLMLGIASLAALTTPVMLVVPALGIGAGLLARRAIARSGGGLTGDGLACVGIGLSALLLAATIVRDPVRDRLFHRQADEAAQRWIEFLADGDFEGARLMLTGAAINSMLPEREPGGPQMPESEMARIVADRLRKDSLSKFASASNGTMRMEPVGEAVPPEFTGAVVSLARNYRVTTGEDGSPKYLHVSLRRSSDGGSSQTWLVERWQLDDEPPAPLPIL